MAKAVPKKPKPKQAPPRYPLLVRTFTDPWWNVTRCANDAPTVMNGIVAIRRYEIRVELIEEPVEVLRERLKTLWRTTERNSHTWDPMRRAAADLGMTREDLDVHDQGKDHGKF